MSTDSPLTFRVAQQAGSPDKPSEDRVFLTPNASIVLDGASQWTSLERSGGWIAEETGQRLKRGLLKSPDCDLADLLDQAADDLISTFDLKPGRSPSTTVNIVRYADDYLDVLVLCDGPVVILGPDGRVHELRDDRLGTVTAKLKRPLGPPDLLNPAWKKYISDFESMRNQPGGFWCISATREIAKHATTARIAATDAAGLLAMTDGVSAGVERYKRPETWLDAFELARENPRRLIEAVTLAEASDADRSRWPRSKTHDDKSLVSAVL